MAESRNRDLGPLPPDPDDQERAGVERQGDVMFWLTLVAGLLIVVIAVIYSVALR